MGNSRGIWQRELSLKRRHKMCGGASPEIAEQKKVNNTINKQLNTDRERVKKTVKILVLQAYSSYLAQESLARVQF